jgi:hypothetical protein
MRALFASGFVALAMTGAAHAQITCEGSASGKIGEVIASYELEKSGSVKSLAVNWLPERKDGAGVESDNFSRPSLILDYRITDAGVLAGPTGASVLITSFKGDDGKPAPPRSSVTIHASAAGAEPVDWAANTTTGEKALAKLVNEKAPAALMIELKDKAGKTLASSEYDLSQTAEAQRLAQEAKADGDKRVAAFAKLAGEGKAGETCPAG